MNREEERMVQALDHKRACPFTRAWEAADEIRATRGLDAAVDHLKAWLRRYEPKPAPKPKRPDPRAVADAAFKRRAA